jgi:4-hydroxy-tetrahydrodipicolinate reductase
MGRTVCLAVAGDAELELVGAADPGYGGVSLRSLVGEDVPGIDVDSEPGMLTGRGVEVVVDFTHREAARANLAWAAEAGVHAVVGTSGFTDSDLAGLRASFTSSNCLIAPNFAIGAVLMMRFAELAAPWFETAEVIELHHDQKVDSPSGTAMRTVERMAEASKTWNADPTTTETIDGARGADHEGIHVHSVRLAGLVAHQEVLLGTTGQSLTIRHDSYDRSSFMPGVLLATKRIGGLPGVTVGLDALLDL